MKINLKKFIEALNIPRKQFLTGLKYIERNFPEHFIRDNKTIVLRRLNDLEQYFNFDITFHEEALLLFKRFWPFIKNTKEEIIASVICILTMVKLNITTHKYKEISDRAGVLMSSVLYQIKHNLMEKLGIRTFQGLKKSRHIVDEVLNSPTI
jgi:hypothetical protein